MEIILTEPVKKLGKIGDIVSVKDGYGRNYLIPTKKAIRATEENKSIFEARRAEIEKHNQELESEANKIVEQIKGKVFSFVKQAGDDGRLFGSVNTKEIAKAVSDATDHKLKHSQVMLNYAIKSVGIYPIEVALHSDINATIYINIARSESEAQDALRDHQKTDEKSSQEGQEGSA